MNEIRHVVRARLMRARRREQDRRLQQELDVVRSQNIVRSIVR